MNILVVSATEFELNTVKSLKIKNLDFAITGIGMLSTLFGLQTAFSKKKYDFVLNMGIAGAFSDLLKVGDIVNVKQETIGDLGFEDKNAFIPMAKSKFRGNQNSTFYNPYSNPFLKKQKQVSSISVNTSSGQLQTISERKDLFEADIENMEGAAVFMFCLEHKIPFAELRSISNPIKERNSSEWDIPLAIKNVNKVAQELIHFLNQGL